MSSEPPNARKTYMMLSKDNQVKYIVDNDFNILHTFPVTHTTTYTTMTDVGGVETITYNKVDTPLYTFRFPEEFVNSKHPRWIEIHHCKCFWNDAETSDLILHTNIIQRDAYLDHAVMNVNETRTKYKKYEYTQQNTHFNIWFTSFAHPNTAIVDTDLTFMIEMMLIY